MPRPSAGSLGAATVLLGTSLSLAGIVWDVQWHVDVGPDTFFTLSHLMLYAGSALSGLAALAMVLRATFAQRAGRTPDPREGGRTVRVLGFDAPLGYLVAGIGAALFLLYGLVDLWWHTVYGFDATLGSPPHVALFGSITVTMVGSVIVFGYAHARRWGRAGLAVALPTLITFSPLMLNMFEDLPLPFDAMVATTAFCCTLSLMLGAGVTGRRSFAVVVAASLGVLQAVLWFWGPWAAHAYARAVRLPLRDDLSSDPPQMPSGVPMFLLASALVMVGVLAYGRRAGAAAAWVPWAAGAAGGVVTAVSFDLQQPLLGVGPLAGPGTLAADALAGLVLGAFAAVAGERFAAMVRGEPRAPGGSVGITVPGPVVEGGLA